MSKFKHPGRSAETVDKRSKQSGGNYDSYINSNINFLKVPEGRNELRILPPTWDTKGPWGDNWGIEVYIHRGIGPDKGSYLCLDEMRKKYGAKAVPERLGDCPLCEARRELGEDDEEGSRALKAGKQILAYVVNRDAERDGVVVWRLGWKMEKDIQGRSSDAKTGAPIIIDDVDHGYDISFRRDGQGLKTQYLSIDVARDETPLSEKPARVDKWMEFVQDNPLPDQLVFYDADYIEQVYMGKKGGKAKDEDEEDDRPSRSKRPARDEEDDAPKRHRAKAADEDEEEETPRRRAARDEDDDDRLPNDREMKANTNRARGKAKDEDEEEDAKPRRRSRDEEEEDEPAPKRRRAAAEDEEEEAPRRRRPDEDEDDEPPKRRAAKDEDEDDEPPQRHRSKAKAKDEEEEEDEDSPPSKRSSRAASKDDDDDEPEGKPKGKSVDRAKAALGRLKGKR